MAYSSAGTGTTVGGGPQDFSRIVRPVAPVDKNFYVLHSDPKTVDNPYNKPKGGLTNSSAIYMDAWTWLQASIRYVGSISTDAIVVCYVHANELWIPVPSKDGTILNTLTTAVSDGLQSDAVTKLSEPILWDCRGRDYAILGVSTAAATPTSADIEGWRT